MTAVKIHSSKDNSCQSFSQQAWYHVGDNFFQTSMQLMNGLLSGLKKKKKKPCPLSSEIDSKSFKFWDMATHTYLSM